MNQYRQQRQRRQATAACLWLALAACGVSGCRTAAIGQNVEGVRLFQSGQYPAALQQFQRAATTDPTSADAFYNMAATYHRLGQEQENQQLLTQAESFYNQCLDRTAEHVDAHRGLAVLLAQTDRRDKAFTLLRNWVLRSPQSADARVELARLNEEYGDPPAAITHLEQALQLDNQNDRAWAALARLREQAGDYEQALVNYQWAYYLNRSRPEVAARISSLNQTLSAGGAAGNDPTRTVNAINNRGRY